MRIPELTLAFNRQFGATKTEPQITSTLKSHRITCGRPKGTPKGTLREYTDEQADFIRENYRRMSLAHLVLAFNERFKAAKFSNQIRGFTRNHAIRSGRTGCFEKKHTPWNAGTKGQAQDVNLSAA